MTSAHVQAVTARAIARGLSTTTTLMKMEAFSKILVQAPVFCKKGALTENGSLTFSEEVRRKQVFPHCFVQKCLKYAQKVKKVREHDSFLRELYRSSIEEMSYVPWKKHFSTQENWIQVQFQRALMALNHRPVFVQTGDKLCTMFNFIEFVVYSMRNPAVYPIIGPRKKQCFADYISCYVSFNQAANST